MEVNDRNGRVVATFPIHVNEGIMLVSDGGQVIRTGVTEVRIAGRRTQGVTLFKVAADEHVVSVARLPQRRAPASEVGGWRSESEDERLTAPHDLPGDTDGSSEPSV